MGFHLALYTRALAYAQLKNARLHTLKWLVKLQLELLTIFYIALIYPLNTWCEIQHTPTHYKFII